MNNIVLLDTSVVSLLYRKDRILAAHYEAHILKNIPVISFQTVAELLSWPIENRWGENKRDNFHSFINSFVSIPYTYSLALVWAEVGAHFKRLGRRLESGDKWIIATAIHRKIPLLTHDRDFLGIDYPGLEIISYLN